MTCAALLALAGLLYAVTARCRTAVSLSEYSWSVSNAELNVSVPALFPSQVHLDLYAGQVIGNPLFGLNDFNLRWVAWSNWTYNSEPLLGLESNTTTYLIFDGLDTFTSISLCGQHVADTNNQFRQYFFDVTSIVASCDVDAGPILSINFGSAPNIADSLAAAPGAETWPSGVQQVYEFPNRWFIRKEQSDFGWDWGPAFAPAGPWLPGYIVQLKAQNDLYVRNVLVDIYRQGQMNNMNPDQSRPWVLNASIDYLGGLSTNVNLIFKIVGPEGSVAASGNVNNVTTHEGTITGSTFVDPVCVELWWPHGLGMQNLYDLTLDIMVDSHCVATIKRRVGFRTIVLDEGVITQEELDMGIAPGNRWQFKINGHEFFAKGSNFIPPDAFWPRVTEEKMRSLFRSVIDGNQNMLRVWASGAYLPDFIYSLADEMGILLWSEFEFGDALYPVNHEFLENVYEEVNYQVRRINYHPSLAFWAGGNELENLELQLVNNSAPDEYLRYKKEYELLFLDTIVPAVFGNTKSISYAPSSTSNGYISLNVSQPPYFFERYENLEPGSIYGETDYYNYDSAIAFNYSTYPVGRFSNEFGYHSMPSLQSWQQQINPRDLLFNSTVIKLRNHHNPPSGLSTTNTTNSELGMGQMTIAAERWYPVPNKTDPVANFSAWCLTTQIFQADYYTSQISFYRRGSGMPQRQLGSLYWQLEDIWAAPSWAGIEYDGRWKMLHYRARDIYKNVIISPFFDTNTSQLEIYVTSDLWEPAVGIFSVCFYDWSGTALDVPSLDAVPVTVGAINTTMVYKQTLSLVLADHDLRDVVMEMSVNVTGRLPNNDTVQSFTHTNWFHAAPLSTARLVDPGLVLTHSPSTNEFAITAVSGVAAWVWLDTSQGAIVVFDDNGFWLRPGQIKTMSYNVKSDATSGAWAQQVMVQSLWNNTLSR